MTVKTRYFVIVSLAVVGVGLGTGLVAYYVGFPTSAFTVRGGPEELRYLPSSATVVAYADVRDVMTSELRQRFRGSILPGAEKNGQREFQELTGINIESDIDHVVAALGSTVDGADQKAGVVLARGRFGEGKIEALMREHGAQVEIYKGKRLITTLTPELPSAPDAPLPSPSVPKIPRQSFSLTFVEPGLAALGTTTLVQHVIDLHNGGGESALTNEGLMERVRALDGGNVWAVGRFDVLRARANLPAAVTDRLPPITWLSVSGRVNGGIQAVLSAEARDGAAAKNLRDVVQGFLALAKLQTGANPEVQRFVDSVQLQGAGNTVALSLDVPAQVFDALSAVMPKPAKKEEGIK